MKLIEVQSRVIDYFVICLKNGKTEVRDSEIRTSLEIPGKKLEEIIPSLEAKGVNVILDQWGAVFYLNPSLLEEK